MYKVIFCMWVGTLVIAGGTSRRPAVVDRGEDGVCFVSRGLINTGKFSSWRAVFVIHLPQRIEMAAPPDFCGNNTGKDLYAG